MSALEAKQPLEEIRGKSLESGFVLYNVYRPGEEWILDKSGVAIPEEEWR